jgi:recombination protein RecT
MARPTKSGQQAPKGENRLEALRDYLSNESVRAGIRAALPKHMSHEKLLKLVLSAASRDKKLLACSPASIALAAMNASALGLEPNTPLGLAYLVPYERRARDPQTGEWYTAAVECQFIPGYRGMITLAIQSGAVQSISARLVYDGDDFVVEYGTAERVHHRPNLDGSMTDEEIVAVYAVAKLASGEVVFDVLSRAQVDRIRTRSKASKAGPWVTDYAEMARKTAVRRLAKYIPMSPDKAQGFQRAVAAEDALETEGVEIADLTDAAAEQGESYDPTTGEVHPQLEGGERKLSLKEQLEASVREKEAKEAAAERAERAARVAEAELYPEPGSNG